MTHLLERLARQPWLHYWEQRIVGLDFYPRVKASLSDAGALQPGLRVLEIGCGQGILAEWFGEGVYVGVDTDFGSLRFAASRVPRGRFLSGDATGLSFQDRFFDFVISVGILHHLDDAQFSKHFQEAFRVLAPEGKLIVFDCLKPDRKDFVRYGFSALERGNYLRTLEELKRCLSRFRPVASPLTRSKTWLLQNYSIVLQKSESADFSGKFV